VPTSVRLRIEGHHLPGRRCGPYDEVHVALQVGRDPVDLVTGDAASAAWETDLTVVPSDGDEPPDVRGPAVQGRRGERFTYLTWGSTAGGGFEMFRRAKLMLDEVPALVGDGPGQVTARVHLTDEAGMPRCARLRPPAVEWSRR
jgi:hypothetical protein